MKEKALKKKNTFMIFDIKSNVKCCIQTSVNISEVGVNTPTLSHTKAYTNMSKSMWTCDGTLTIHDSGSVEKERSLKK